jgi:hypothetical protein
MDTSNIPSVWDWADGGRTNPNGTPSIGGLLYNSSTGGVINNPGGYSTLFEEMDDSPVIEGSEQNTVTHVFKVDWYTGAMLQQMYTRGTAMMDSGLFTNGYPNVSRVLTTRLQPDPKTFKQSATFTVVSETTALPAPPNEFGIETVDFNPPLEKHPRYPALTYNDKRLVNTSVVSDYTDISFQNLEQLNELSSSDIQLNDEKSQALELVYKKWKGEDTFYLSGYKIIFSQYFWFPQQINPGGYIENPFLVVPWAYWQDVNGNNVFMNTCTYNENVFPNANTPESTQPPFGLSWLRKTDSQVLNRTWWKVTSTWEGAPLGIWDNELYSPYLQPYQTSATQGQNTLTT